MIEAKESLIGSINSKQSLSGELNKATEYIPPITQEKNAIPTKEEQIITPDEGFTGLSKVNIEAIPDEYIIPTGEIEITANGTYDVKDKEVANVDIVGFDTSDATATAGDIASGKTAYISTGIVEGTGTISEPVTKGLVINEYDNEGFPTDVSLVGMTEIPNYYFYYSMYEQGDNKGFLSQAGANLHLSDEITKIGVNAFGRCSELALSKLPNSLHTIRAHAFDGCSRIVLTSLPNGIIEILNNAFEGCSNLELTSLPSGITKVYDYTYRDCYKLSLTSLPDGITTIGKYAFSNCRKMLLKSLPNGIISIGEQAFRDCENIILTELPSGVTLLQNYVFGDCIGLKELNIKGDITAINSGAFYKCENLEKIVFPNITKVPTLGNVNVFKDTPIANGTGYIYVPNDLVESFKTATNWSTYASQIKPINDNTEKIEAINNMKATLENEELILEYDDELLDVDFYIENGDLIVNNNETIVDFSINENKEMEAIY